MHYITVLNYFQKRLFQLGILAMLISVVYKYEINIHTVYVDMLTAKPT